MTSDKMDEQLIDDLVDAVRKVLEAPMGDELLAAFNACSRARKNLLDRMKQLRSGIMGFGE